MNSGLLLAYLTVVSAAAAAPAPEVPAPIQRLTACRQIADGGARLACYDRESETLAVAVRSKDVLVMDRQQIRSTQRSLFGLALPRLPFFDSDDKDGAAPKEIEGVIRAVRVTREGKWVVRVDEASWQTTEVARFDAPPKVGTKAKIRRASLGSYVLVAEGRRGLRAIRLQ